MIRNESGFTGKLMTLLTAAHKMLERCWGGYIKKNIPIDKSVVLFNSKPDFADNARALAEYMLEKYSQRNLLLVECSAAASTDMKSV